MLKKTQTSQLVKFNFDFSTANTCNIKKNYNSLMLFHNFIYWKAFTPQTKLFFLKKSLIPNENILHFTTGIAEISLNESKLANQEKCELSQIDPTDQTFFSLNPLKTNKLDWMDSSFNRTEACHSN